MGHSWFVGLWQCTGITVLVLGELWVTCHLTFMKMEFVGIRLVRTFQIISDPYVISLTISDVALVEEVSQSRMRAAYDETQRIVQEESCARMNDRMWKDKQGQLVDIWI